MKVTEATAPATATVEMVNSALERARVVGVLDSWLGQSIQHIAELTIALTRGEWILNLWKGTAIVRTFYAASPDEARAAAAKAIEAGEV